MADAVTPERRAGPAPRPWRVAAPGAAALLGAGGTVALVLLYWLLAWLYMPAEPARVAVLYRFGDTDYLPAIYALARGELGVAVDPATAGRGLLPFPALMLLPHALGVAIFGDRGFAVADAAVALLHFWLAWRVAGLLVRDRGPRAATAFLVVVALFAASVWSFRYPRPFVSHLFLLGTVVAGARLWSALRSGRPGRRAPLLLGLVAGAAAQGDLHAAVGYGAAIAALYAAWIYRRGRPDAGELRAVLWTGAAFLLGIGPLFVHARFASGDLLARWGMYPVARGQIEIQVTTVVLLFFLFAVAALLLRLRAVSPGGDEPALLAMLLCLCFGALAAGPLVTWVIGRQIQVYHFQDRLVNVSRLALLLAGWGAVCHAARRSPRLLTGLALLLSAAPLALMLRTIHARARLDRQPRVHWNHSPQPGYRRDVASLFREIQGRAYRDRHLLGTFDQQLGMLWATDRRHLLYVPDTFLSGAADEEIETRTIALSRLLGMDARQFAERIQDEYFQKRFLTLGKWQLSRAYVASGLDDYDIDELRAGFSTNLTDTWRMALPASERRRLLRRFDTAPAPAVPPDLIILSVVPPFTLRPPGPPYRLAYANPSFRVFIRDAAAGAAPAR